MGASYLISLNITVLGFLGLVLFVLWNHDRRKKTAFYWAVALSLVAIHWVINLYRGTWPESVVVLTTNPLVQAGIALIVAATYIRTNRKPPWILLSFGWLATILPLAWFLLIQPHIGIRILIVSASMVIHFTWAGWLSYRWGSRRHKADTLMGICLMAIAVLCASRLVFLLNAGIPRQLDHFDPYVGAAILVAIPSVFVGCGLFVILGIGLDLMDELREVAERDPLTDTLNRRGFMDRAQQELARAERKDRPLAVIAGDLDHFKTINDRFGHAAGDLVIKTFADILKAGCREHDLVGRLGGEEFFVLLPEATEQQALDIAERIRRLYEGAIFDGELADHKVTASFGVAQLTPQDSGIDNLLTRADIALYEAKRQGRNKTILADEKDYTVAPAGFAVA